MDLVFEQYLEKLRRKGKSPHTIRSFTYAARRLQAWLDSEGLNAETATFTALEDYFDGLDLAPSSVGTDLRYIQAAYNYAIRRGTIRHNPVLDVEPPAVPQKEPRIIPAWCLKTIKGRIGLTKDWLFFHLLAYTGMRRNEVRFLKWDDGLDDGSVVRLEQGTILVRGKGGKLRYVPIHPALGEVLAEETPQPGRPVIPSAGQGIALSTVQDIVKRLSPVYTPHDYRRTVATSLRRNGVDSGVIDRIMGWAPATIFRRYYDNVADGELQRAILKLYADDPV